MKTIRIAIIGLALLVSFQCTAQQKGKPAGWNLEKEKSHNQNRNDSTKWSTQNWQADKQRIRLQGKPMVNGVFPVPRYELADSTFGGLGNGGDWKGVGLQGRNIIYHTMYVNENTLNKLYLANQPNEVFFSIMVLTDTVDTSRYSHTNVEVSSRNHPHYAGQGYVRTKRSSVDFTAFLTADRNAYALVNMRLFDLRIGSIVLIAPQKDGTFRSLQLQSPVISSEETDSYLKGLLTKNEEVIKFFMQPGTI